MYNASYIKVARVIAFASTCFLGYHAAAQRTSTSLEARVSVFNNEKFDLDHSVTGRTIVDVNLDGRNDMVFTHRYGRLTVLLATENNGYEASQSHRIGSRFRRVANGDLNRDGYPDIVTLNDVKSKLHVFLNDGDGRFHEVNSYDTPVGPKDLLVEDLDRDGFVEVIVVSPSTDTVAVYSAGANGELNLQASIGSVATPTHVVSGDLDHDGTDELVVAGSTDARLYVLKQRSHERWDVVSFLAIPGYVDDLLVQDMNGDDELDLAVVTHSDAFDGAVHMYLGDRGIFALESTHERGSRFNKLAAADTDGDGISELAVTVWARFEVQVLKQDPEDGLQITQRLHTVRDPNWVDFEDVNTDGRVDLLTTVTTGGSENVQLNLNAGDGRFRGADRVTAYPARALPLVADLNADGLDDIVWNDHDSMYVRYAIEPGAYAQEQRLFVPVRYGVPVPVDLNADGLPELVVTDSDTATLSVLWNDETDAFGSSVSFVGPGSSTSRVEVEDIDSNGRPDLVISFRNSSTFFVLRNDGDGVLELLTYRDIITRDDVLSLIDFDSDGDLDIAALDDQEVRLFQNIGSDTFEFHSVINLPYSGFSLCRGDFDGDDDQDLAVIGSSKMMVCMNMGAGDFGVQSQKIDLTSFNNYSFRIRGVDMDQDGDLDVLCTSSTRAQTLTNTGFGEFHADASFHLGLYTNEPRDVDDDGDLDIEAYTSTPSSRVWFINDFGDGCLADTTLDGVISFDDVSLYIRLYLADRAAADVDGNGLLDISDVMFFMASYTDGC